MKKIIISLILAVSFVATSYAAGVSPQLKYAIKQYKNKNYIGSMQTLEEITAKDPGDALAHYYLGMCYVQIGDVAKADAEYNTVITLSPNSELAKNANIGKNNLTGNPQPANNPNNLDKFINPLIQKREFLSDEAKEKIQEKNIKTIIENVNNKRENDPAIYNRIENLEPKKSSSDEKPTQEQITEALEILKKAGINPANATNSYMANMQASQINPEMMQMNMLMSAFGGGGNNNMNGGNSMNNMLPMLMMMQNGQGNNKVDPETIQVMMSQMMMPGMMNLYDNNNNNN